MTLLYAIMHMHTHVRVHLHVHIISTHKPDSRLTQSMEQLSPLPVDEKEGVKGFSTPGVTPIGTPRMPRSRSKSKLTRRSSEPDLEGAREFFL